MTAGERFGDLGYAPGTWIAIAGPTSWLLADLLPEDAAVARCWRLIREGSAAEEVLDVLRFGSRPGHHPAFAFVHGDPDTTRVIVSGDARVELAVAERHVVTIGRTTGDPTDEKIPGTLRGLRLTAEPGDGDSSDNSTSLPLSAGVVLASKLGTSMPVTRAVPRADPLEKYVALLNPDYEPATTLISDVSWAADLLAPMESGREVDFGDLAQFIPLPTAPLSTPPEPPYPITDEDVAGATVRRTKPWSPHAFGTVTVQATHCAAGHPNPVEAELCRVCEDPIRDREPRLVPRPVLGVLVLSTGGTPIPLDRDVILGRDPREPDLPPDRQPNLIQVTSGDHEISRDHLAVRLDGWQVVVEDLGSTNGTYVTPPAGRPEMLRADQRRSIAPGTVVSLSETVSFVYEVAG